MRPLLALALVALPVTAATADDLSCRLTDACVQGGPCVRANVPLVVEDADGLSPVMSVGGVAVPVTREFNFYGTVFNGWNDAGLPLSQPGELWVRPNGRTTYVRRGEIEGVVVRTDYRGRCVMVPAPDVAAATEALK